MKNDVAELQDAQVQLINTFATELKRLPAGNSRSDEKVKVLLRENSLPVGYLPNQPGEWLRYLLKILSEAQQEGAGMFGSQSAEVLAAQLPLVFAAAFRHIDFQLTDYQVLKKRKIELEGEVSEFGQKKTKMMEEIKKLEEEKIILKSKLESAETIAAKMERLEAEKYQIVQEKAEISAKLSMSQDLGKEINKLVQAVSVAGSTYSFYNGSVSTSTVSKQQNQEQKQDPVKDSAKMLRFWSPARLLFLLVIGQVSGYVPLDRLQSISKDLQTHSEMAIAGAVKGFLPLLDNYLKSPLDSVSSKVLESFQNKAILLIQRLYSEQKSDIITEVLRQLTAWGTEGGSSGVSVFADSSAGVWRGISECLSKVAKEAAFTKDPAVTDTTSMITRIYHMLSRGGSLLPKAETGRGAFYADMIKYHQMLSVPKQKPATTGR